MFVYLITYGRDSVGGCFEEMEIFTQENREGFLERIEELSKAHNVHSIESFSGFLDKRKE